MEILNEALRLLGYLEKRTNAQLADLTANAGNNNYTLFAQWYKDQGYGNYQGQPWCAMFISFIFGQVYANAEEIMPHFHYCPTAVSCFKNMGRYHVSNPRVGDVIFFKDNTGTPCHVGIVRAVDSNSVYTYEGNTSSAAGVVANGGCVAAKSYKLSYNKIHGYGRPKYEGGITMAMYDDFNSRIASLENKIATVETKMIYNYIDDNMPDWARPTIQKLVDRGFLKGNENGELHLTDEMLKIFVINDRAGLYV